MITVEWDQAMEDQLRVLPKPEHPTDAALIEEIGEEVFGVVAGRDVAPAIMRILLRRAPEAWLDSEMHDDLVEFLGSIAAADARRFGPRSLRRAGRPGPRDGGEMVEA